MSIIPIGAVTAGTRPRSAVPAAALWDTFAYCYRETQSLDALLLDVASRLPIACSPGRFYGLLFHLAHAIHCPLALLSSPAVGVVSCSHASPQRLVVDRVVINPRRISV